MLPSSGAELLGHVGGAVGAAVVDHQDPGLGQRGRIGRRTRSMFSASLYVGSTTRTATAAQA